MNLTRARVAITPAYFSAASPLISKYTPGMTHVGHARSLLLGSLIAKEMDLPFHVRLDGLADGTGDRGTAVLDIVNCINFLNIDYDYMYWTAQSVPPMSVIANKFGEEAAQRLQMILNSPLIGKGHYYGGQLLDDFFTYHPSLIIRGREFIDPNTYFDPPNANGHHVHIEDMICNALGIIKNSLSVPMMCLDNKKMSKTQMNIVHWTALTSVSAYCAREFLLRTALWPDDPLEHEFIGFETNSMSQQPYLWSWHLWGEYIGKFYDGSWMCGEKDV